MYLNIFPFSTEMIFKHVVFCFDNSIRWNIYALHLKFLLITNTNNSTFNVSLQ